ncbi:MAG: hypothetical protein RI573_04380 [Balneolaceae bacterium]|nr:hypothetical protein [Balneolaceae bacterium]
MSILISKKSINNISEENVFKTIDHNQNYIVNLINGHLDVSNLDIPITDYYYLSLSPKLYIEGECTEAIEQLPVLVKGANTFIIHNLEEDDFDRLQEFYQLGHINNYPELEKLLSSRPPSFLDDFIEEYDEYEGDDEDIDAIWEIFDEIVNHTGEDYYDVTNDVKYQLMFKKLGLYLEERKDIKTLICIMDEIELNQYIKYRSILIDEMSELKEGNFDFSYSLWEEDYNVDLFETLDIDNGDYLSFPTLYYDEFMNEPETGHWS